MPLFHPALQLPLQSCTNSIFQPAGGTRFSTKLFICLLYSSTRPLHGLNALAVYVETPPYVTYATMYIISIFRDTFSNYTQLRSTIGTKMVVFSENETNINERGTKVARFLFRFDHRRLGYTSSSPNILIIEREIFLRIIHNISFYGDSTLVLGV